MSIAPPAELASKKFILISEVTALEGKADELQKHLSTLQRQANSSKEPGTLTFRVTRGVGNEGNKFTVVEEYENKEALEQHTKSEAIKALTDAGVISDFSIAFREEFQ